MKKNKKIYNIIIVLFLILIFNINNLYASVGCYAEIGPITSLSNVKNGDTIIFQVNYTGDVAEISLNRSSILLNGFNANVSITGSGNSRNIVLSKIQGYSAAYITILPGSARSSDYKYAEEISSIRFNIKDSNNSSISNTENTNVNTNNTNTINNTTTYTNNKSNIVNKNSKSYNKPSNNKFLNDRASNIINQNVENANNDSSQAVDNDNTKKNNNTCYDIENWKINNEINYFSTWFTSKRENVYPIQENNYISKDKEMTYIIDYYNGQSNVANNIIYTLDIPENVTIEEINKDGKIIEQTAQNAKIEWTLNNISSGDKCRLCVKVKFLADEVLEKSPNLSRIFYVRLKMNNNNDIKYQYIKQLYIDNNINKLNDFIDYTYYFSNDIISNDKITIIDLISLLSRENAIPKTYSDDYKKYSDYKKIPAELIYYVSTIENINVIETKDNKLNPNNPILMDDFLKIIAKLSAYLSDSKYIIDKPLYMNDSLTVNNNEKKYSDDKNYIMELVRENILDSKEKIDINSYVTKKDAVKFISALLFKGPYINRIDSNVKFVNISNKYAYFYNISTMFTKYKYYYDQNLYQNISIINN